MMKPAMKIYSAAELARLKGISPAIVRRLCREKALPAHWNGDRWCIYQSAVDAFEDFQRAASALVSQLPKAPRSRSYGKACDYGGHSSMCWDD